MHKRDVFPCLFGLAVLAACDPDIHDPGLDIADEAPQPGSIDDSDLLLSLDPELDAESAYDGNVWLDACQSQDPDLQRLLDANAMLVPTGSLQANGNGTFKIVTTPFTEHAGKPLVPQSLFYGQRRVGAGRTGVLVGPDIVVTAPHTTNFNFAGFRVVFGLSARMVNGTCVQPDWDQVPAEDIYVPVEMVANTYTAVADPHDFAFMRLDRHTDREPLRIRRSGKAQDGDNLVGVGHPMRLSAKLSPEGEALGWDDAKGLLLNGLHFLDGSSGSMVYNRDADYLETVVRTGLCGQLQSLPLNTFQLVPLCPAAPRAVNRPIADIAAVVPAASLVVSPLDEVEHRANRNTTPTNAISLYTLRAPSGQPPTQWQIIVPPAPANQPKLTLSPAQTSGVLAPGSAFAFTATASAASDCGNYERTIQVNDVTHGYTDYIRHRFEVGMRQFQVGPAEGFAIERMGAPYATLFKSYTVANPGPTPVDVRVVGPTWVDLTVQQGNVSTKHNNVATFNLASNTSKNNTAIVSVRMDEVKAKSMLLHKTYAGGLTFEMNFGQASPNCYVPSDTTRPLSFVRGKQTFEAYTEGDNIPKPVAPLVRELEIDQPFTIDQVSLDVGIWAFDWTSPSHFSNLRISLESPGGQELLLWDASGVPNPDYYSEEVITHYGYDLPIGVLHIDDVLSPSPLGTELGTLVGESGNGTWKLKMSSPNTAAMLVHWRLNFFGTPTP